MKKFSLFTLFSFLLISLTALGQGKTDKGHSIRVKVHGLGKDTCYIGHYYGKSQYVKVDTAISDPKGNLHFEGPEELPSGVYLLVIPNRYIEFIIGEQKFSMELDTTDIISSMVIKGSPENSTFYEYQRYVQKMGNKMDSLNNIYTADKEGSKGKAARKEMESVDAEVKVFRKEFMEKNSNAFAVKLLKGAQDPDVPEAPKLESGGIDSSFGYRYYKAHYWDNFDWKEEGLIRTPFFHGKLEKYFKNLVVQVPDSINHEADYILGMAKANKEAYKYCIWWIFNNYEGSNIMGMDAVMVHIGEKYYLSGEAYWADSTFKASLQKRVKILKPLLIGNKAPDLYLTDSTGKMIRLYEIQSKYIILWFFDSDCGHCMKETPLVYDFYQKNKHKGIKVYAASIERDPANWKKYLKEKGFTDWINVWDSHVYTDFSQVYDVYATPVLYVLDKDKKIIAKRLTSEQLQDFFDTYEKFQAKK